jgi:hypothetical protein
MQNFKVSRWDLIANRHTLEKAQIATPYQPGSPTRCKGRHTYWPVPRPYSNSNTAALITRRRSTSPHSNRSDLLHYKNQTPKRHGCELDQQAMLKQLDQE